MKRNSRDVLQYRPGATTSRSTVRRHYLRWRAARGIPDRCEMSSCVFQTAPLVWNEGELPLILDHINGNNSDNRPKNLRLVCPNCNAQLDTHGGGNIGKIEKSEGGFAIISKPTGVRTYVLPAEGGSYTFSGAAVTVTKHRRIDGRKGTTNDK